jgi:hypothetical protein
MRNLLGFIVGCGLLIWATVLAVRHWHIPNPSLAWTRLGVVRNVSAGLLLIAATAGRARLSDDIMIPIIVTLFFIILVVTVGEMFVGRKSGSGSLRG